MGRFVRGVIVLLLVITAGCQLIKKTPKAPIIEYPTELAGVNEMIMKKQTVSALERIEDYLNNSANIHWHGHAYFLRGFVYEVDGKLDMAKKAYRQAIKHSAQYDSKVTARALYNLSFVYEKQEDYQNLLLTSLDLMKKRQFFDVMTAQVEIPARTAAVYAAHGKMKEGEIFHREASQNLKTLLRRRNYQADPLDLSKSLYYLGFASFNSNKESYASLIRKLDIGQKYFLASTESSNSIWAEKSKERLTSLYDQAWGMVNAYQPKDYKHDRMAFRKQQQMRQLVMASQLYDLTFRLRAEEFPMGSANQRSKDLVDMSKGWTKKIEAFAQNLDLGPEMIRDKAVPNTKLAVYIDKLEPLNEVNKEMTREVEPIQVKKRNSPALPPKKKAKDIGKDPNL